MLWLILAFINAAGYAICSFIDNYVTDVLFKGKNQEAIKIFSAVTYVLTSVVIWICFGMENIDAPRIALLLGAGVLSSTASIPYYRALTKEETTTASIFLQLTPVIYLIADSLIFGENISLQQFLAFIIIIMAPAVIAFSRRHKSARKLELSAAAGFITYVVLAAASGLITAHVGEGYQFTTIFAWFMFGRGVMDFIYYFTHKNWRKAYRRVSKKYPRQLYTSLIVSQVVFIFCEFAGRYALTLESPALVSVVSNAGELILVFILGIILSIIWPVFGREKLSRHIIVAHLIATILAVTGIILLG